MSADAATHLSLYFTPEQLEAIDQPFDPERLAKRKGGGNRTFGYAEGDLIVALLDDIIGIDRWSYRTRYVRDIAGEYQGPDHRMCFLTFYVEGTIEIHRLPTAPPGPNLIYTRIGCCTAEYRLGANPREQMATAGKGACTDGIKRASATIGRAFNPRTALTAETRSERRDRPPRSTQRGTANDNRSAGVRRSAKGYVENLRAELELLDQDARKGRIQQEQANIEILPARARQALDVILQSMGVEAA